MTSAIELSGHRRDELLNEAVSRQTPLTLDCRQKRGWVTVQSLFLGQDRASGDLVVRYPAVPAHLTPEFVEGQSLGLSFRRAHRKCVFETAVTGRCFYSSGPLDDVPALRLLWPTSVFELQRRLYYRTPVPENMSLPVQVWPWDAAPDDSGYGQPLRGQMVDLSAGGVSLIVEDRSRQYWMNDTRVGCSFTPAPGGEPLELYGHTRYLRPAPTGEYRLGVQFIGLEALQESRPKLEQILELTSRFQSVQMNRMARA